MICQKVLLYWTPIVTLHKEGQPISKVKENEQGSDSDPIEEESNDSYNNL